MAESAYSNYAGGNLLHKYETIKFDNSRQSVFKSAEQTKKSTKVTSPQITGTWSYFTYAPGIVSTFWCGYLLGLFNEDINVTGEWFTIPKKFQFENLEIPCTQWKGTFQLNRPNSSHSVYDYCTCKQDTGERYWGQQFCQLMEGHFSPTDQNDQLVRVDHAGQTELKWFIPLDFWMKFPELWAERKVLIKSTSPQLLCL